MESTAAMFGAAAEADDAIELVWGGADRRGDGQGGTQNRWLKLLGSELNN
jgi:hypothetical protein